MTVRKYTSRSQQTTLTGSVSSATTTWSLANITALLGSLSPAAITGGATFTVVIDPDTALEEICDITSATTTTVVVTRGVDGSSAVDHTAGAIVRHMVIGRDLVEANTHSEATGGVHGIASTSAVVGTTDTQTLTNKTLTAPVINSLADPVSAQQAATKAYADSVGGSAAISAASSLATYNLFKTDYLGAFATAPTLNNVGAALKVGASYFNTTTNIFNVYNGSAWLAVTASSPYGAPTLGSTVLTSGTTIGTVTAINLTNSTVTADPTAALGIASKQYVDAVTVAINFHAPVVAATTSALTVTYNNGTSGVGATITSTTNGVLGTLDGVTLALTNRVLIKNQAAGLQNGVYTVTNLGSAGTPWVMTRATDQDNNIPGEFANGDVLLCLGGTANSGKTFVNSSSGAITVGTTAVSYSEFTTSLPSQTGNAGKFLQTDGSVPSWQLATTNGKIYFLKG